MLTGSPTVPRPVTPASHAPSSPVHALRVEEVTTAAAFHALRPAWNALLEKCPRPEIYLTHEWLSSWWECMGKGRSLMILAVYDGGELAAIAPFMRHRERMLGIPVRKIEFISMMQYADAPTNCSASLDLLIPARRAEAVTAIAAHLARCRWDLLRLHPIPSGSGTAGLLEGAAIAHGWHARVQHIYDNAVVAVATKWDGYLKTLSPRFTKGLRAQERRLANKGELKFVEIDRRTPVDEVYNRLLDIERRSWKWNIGISLNSVVFNDFYRVFAERAFAQGMLRIWMMQVNGRDVAYDYIVDYLGHAASLKTSYDNEFRNFGPGNLLTWHEFQRFFEDGTREISLLWGDMANKGRWAPSLDPHVELTVWRPGMRGMLIRAAGARILPWRRTAIELAHRLARKIGIHPRSSELTRADQVAPSGAAAQNDHDE